MILLIQISGLGCPELVTNLDITESRYRFNIHVLNILGALT